MERIQDIRTCRLQQRDHIDDALRKQYSQMIMQRLMQTEEYRAASFLYCYMNIRSEVMTRTLIAAAIEAGKHVAIPGVKGQMMEFYTLAHLRDVRPGYMGIMESCSDCVQQQPGLLLAPGSVFDRAGNRLGYGGGFYDRYLASHPDHIKIGLAYECQIVPKLNPEPHDIAMDVVITEAHTYRGK